MAKLYAIFQSLCFAVGPAVAWAAVIFAVGLEWPYLLLGLVPYLRPVSILTAKNHAEQYLMVYFATTYQKSKKIAPKIIDELQRLMKAQADENKNIDG